MSPTLSALSYLVSGILFILSLQGLSSAKTSRRGNLFGIIGMTLAIGTCMMAPSMSDYTPILMAILFGGGIGFVIAKKIQMTALPQLVAAFHSLVGLAAVFVAAAALNSPHVFDIGTVGNIYTASLFEMSLGAAIGALTFSGSIIAFG